MKKWISAAVLTALVIVSRGVIIAILLIIPALDIFIAVKRDHRYKFVPWPLTRRTWRLLFVSPPKPVPAVTWEPSVWYLRAPR